MMQISDPTLIPSLVTAIVAALVAVYLYNLWHRQPVRLYTDLPLMFSLCFIGTAANMLMHGIPLLLEMEQTLDLFRIRSLTIGLSVIPMVGMLFHIWLPKYAKWHIRALVVIVAYWLAVVSLGTTDTIIIILTVPILLTFTVALAATFAITWKTHRLEEVRSDLLVVALVIAFATQALKVLLMNSGLDIMVYIMNVIMMVMVGLALVNPWYRMADKRTEKQVEAIAY